MHLLLSLELSPFLKKKISLCCFCGIFASTCVLSLTRLSNSINSPLMAIILDFFISGRRREVAFSGGLTVLFIYNNCKIVL